jgi:hypothetical protein
MIKLNNHLNIVFCIMSMLTANIALAENIAIKAWIEIQQMEDSVKIMPTAQWLKKPSNQNQQYQYKLTVEKTSTSGKNRSSQRGIIPIATIGQNINLSSVSINTNSIFVTNITLSIMHNGRIILTKSKTLSGR